MDCRFPHSTPLSCTAVYQIACPLLLSRFLNTGAIASRAGLVYYGMGGQSSYSRYNRLPNALLQSFTASS
jgi:hypothetical protein